MTNRPSHVSWLTWQLWGLEDLRNEALLVLTDNGLPMTAILPLEKLPLFLGAAEYACKLSVWEAPLMVLSQLEHDARNWFE